MDNSTNQKQAIDDIAKALENVFRKYSLKTRKTAWRKIQTPKGQESIAKIITDPKRKVKSLFEPLTFKQYVKTKDR